MPSSFVFCLHLQSNLFRSNVKRAKGTDSIEYSSTTRQEKARQEERRKRQEGENTKDKPKDKRQGQKTRTKKREDKDKDNKKDEDKRQNQKKSEKKFSRNQTVSLYQNFGSNMTRQRTRRHGDK